VYLRLKSPPRVLCNVENGDSHEGKKRNDVSEPSPCDREHLKEEGAPSHKLDGVTSPAGFEPRRLCT
jgi:hypothetical protein